MRRTRIPPILADIIQTTLTAVDGVLFDSCDACPSCGGEVSGYDMKRRQFAVVMEKEGKKTVTIQVKRFRCRRCNRICSADQPFYPNTRIGSPVIDLCITLGETMHVPRVSLTLAEMGIVVDRWSVRNYTRKNAREVPAVEMFGIRVPLTVFSLSSLAAETQGGNRGDAARILEACGYPSRKQISIIPPENDTPKRSLG